jgi:hypothetical protein
VLRLHLVAQEPVDVPSRRSYVLVQNWTEELKRLVLTK